MMTICRITLALLLALGLSVNASASPDDAVLMNLGDPGCEWLTTTNHFELAPGEVVEFELDLSKCDTELLGGLLFSGYKTTKNSSKPLEIRDGIDLKILDFDTGEEVGIASTSRYERSWTDLDGPGFLVVSAENTNRSKTLKIRLRTRCYEL